MQDHNGKPLKPGDIVDIVGSTGNPIGLLGKVHEISTRWKIEVATVQWWNDKSISHHTYSSKKLHKLEI